MLADKVPNLFPAKPAPRRLAIIGEAPKLPSLHFMLADTNNTILNLSGISLAEPPTIPTFCDWEPKQPGLYWNCDYWFEDVIEDREVTFDAMVYTASWLQAGKCRRLVCAKLFGGHLLQETKVRKAANVHTKLFLVRGRRINEVWLGSCNLVSSKSWHNVMIQVKGEDAKSLRQYFEKVWRLCAE